MKRHIAGRHDGAANEERPVAVIVQVHAAIHVDHQTGEHGVRAQLDGALGRRAVVDAQQDHRIVDGAEPPAAGCRDLGGRDQQRAEDLGVVAREGHGSLDVHRPEDVAERAAGRGEAAADVDGAGLLGGIGVVGRLDGQGATPIDDPPHVDRPELAGARRAGDREVAAHVQGRGVRVRVPVQRQVARHVERFEVERALAAAEREIAGDDQIRRSAVRLCARLLQLRDQGGIGDRTARIGLGRRAGLGLRGQGVDRRRRQHGAERRDASGAGDRGVDGQLRVVDGAVGLDLQGRRAAAR